jgi:hypothetical protein
MARLDVKVIIKFLFLFPYIGGILIIISLLTPAAMRWYHSTVDDSYILWVWGLLTITEWYHGAGWAWNTTFAYIPDPFILVIGILFSIIIAIFGIKMILKARICGDKEKDLDITFVKYGGLIITLITTWMIIVQIFYSMTDFLGLGTNFSFWPNLSAQFGVIGIFLGGIFSILGYVLFKIYRKKFYYLYV